MKAIDVILDSKRMIALLLTEPWQQACEIIPDYMPPYPNKDTVPSCKVRFNNGSEYPPFLRYSCGPAQGFFWDIYGDHMQTVELAILAVSKAPCPRDVGPTVFKVKCDKENN